MFELYNVIKMRWVEDDLMYKDLPLLSGRKPLLPPNTWLYHQQKIHFLRDCAAILSIFISLLWRGTILIEWIRKPSSQTRSTWAGKAESSMLLLCRKHSRFQWGLQGLQHHFLSNSHRARLLGRAFGMWLKCQPHLRAEVQCSAWACWSQVSLLAPEGVGLDWEPRGLYWLCLRCVSWDWRNEWGEVGGVCVQKFPVLECTFQQF